jgi:hypothetical protein
MIIQDRMFFNYQEAVETYLRMGFEFIENKKLVLNGMEVEIRKQGNDIWRTKIVHKYETDPKVMLMQSV